MAELNNLQRFAAKLLRADWAYSFSDDASVVRQGVLFFKEVEQEVTQYGANGARILHLFKRYFWNFSDNVTGDEWRLVGALLWLNGIHKDEEYLSTYVDGNRIQWGKLRKNYPDFDFKTW